MNRGLWILAGMALAGTGAMLWMSQSLVTTVSGVEEARTLQDALRFGSGAICLAEPPLRVLLVPGPAGEGGGRWRVEASLRAGQGPGIPLFEAWRERAVVKALATRLRGKPPAGVILQFHRAGAADLEMSYDGAGVRVPAAPDRGKGR